MPLHLDRLDQTVGAPGRRLQVAPDQFERLVVVAVDQNALAHTHARQETLGPQPHAVRRALARRALLVLERRRDFRRDVLYERAPARDVQNLHAVADAEERDAPLLARLQKEKVCRVAQRVHAAEPLPRLAPAELRIPRRGAARQQTPARGRSPAPDPGPAAPRAPIHPRAGGGARRAEARRPPTPTPRCRSARGRTSPSPARAAV